MAANVLNSPRATQMSVFVVRAFVKMQSAFQDSRELANKLALLEQDLRIRLNIHEAAIVGIPRPWRLRNRHQRPRRFPPGSATLKQR